jgi:hypothetical protein
METKLGLSALAAQYHMKPQIVIRRAVIGDLDAITEIYNEAIVTTTATFDTEPKTALKCRRAIAGVITKLGISVVPGRGTESSADSRRRRLTSERDKAKA